MSTFFKLAAPESSIDFIGEHFFYAKVIQKLHLTKKIEDEKCGR